MKFKTFAIGAAMAVALFLFAQRQQSPAKLQFSQVVDLTQPLSEDFPNWEGTAKSPFEARKLGDIDRDGYFSRSISLPEHFATHMDAPAHFAKGAWTVEQIPPERLIAPLVVLDATSKVEQDPDYQVGVEDIAAWERVHGPIPAGAVVVANTGWSLRAGDMRKYRNADEKGVRHFPGYSLDAVKFLVESRNIVGLGIDSMSVDYGPSQDYPVHQYTAAHNLYHLENVRDPGQAPAAGALLVAAPAKLRGGSGGPVRILALVP